MTHLYIKPHLLINKTLALLLIFVLTFSACFIMSTQFTSASAQVVIGQAKRGEKGIKNNKPGEQNGREVYTTPWEYSIFKAASYHWEYVIRPKDHDLARRLAAHMKAACDNKHIGYDQNYPDRGTFYDEARKKNWDISKVTKNCETTCTNCISVCLNAEGIRMPRNWMSGDVYDDLMETGLFECFETKEYTTSPDKLWVGDILVNPNKHTAMVVESSNPFTYKVTYQGMDNKSKTIEIEEDLTVRLNMNNGEKIKFISVREDTDLSAVEPAKSRYEFIGWERSGGRSLSARYKPRFPTITTDNKVRSIKTDG